MTTAVARVCETQVLRRPGRALEPEEKCSRDVHVKLSKCWGRNSAQVRPRARAARAPAAACLHTRRLRRFVEELMKHMEVHSYGRCLKNAEEPPRGKRSPNENKRHVLSQYKW